MAFRKTRARRKVCYFKKNKIKYVDYKDVETLSRFIGPDGKITPRSITGTIFLFRALHVPTQRAAFVPAMRCIGHRTALHFLKEISVRYPPPHLLGPIMPFRGFRLPAGYVLQAGNSPAGRSEEKSRLSPSSCCQSLSE